MSTPGVERKPARPRKELNFARRKGDRIGDQGVAFSGLAGFFSAWWIISRYPNLPQEWALILLVFLTIIPMVAVSVLLVGTHLRESSGLSILPGKTDYRRVAIKYLGLLGTLGFLGICYWTFPEYAKPRYAPFWAAAKWCAGPLLIISWFYFAWADRRMREPKDAYWAVGNLLLGNRTALRKDEFREYALGWLIKGFFLPFMLSGVAEHVVFLAKEGWNPATFASLYLTTITVLFCVDTVFGAVGYLLTLRILDAQIRSAQPQLFGWVVALICYPPFSAGFNTLWRYKGDKDWSTWLQAYPILFITWGFAILVALVVYVWATMSFGCRFSNLTNRGIITSGPYRWTKHPAYIAKNTAWWLMHVPFVAFSTWEDCLRACIMLGCLNGVYYFRAKTEESHLMADPAYRIYARWISRNGLWATLSKIRLFPSHRPDDRRVHA